MKKVWVFWIFLVMGFSSFLLAADPSAPPPYATSHEGEIAAASSSIGTKFIFGGLKEECLRLLDQFEKKMIKPAFLDELDQAVKTTYSVAAPSEFEAAAVLALPSSHFSQVRSSFQRLFAELKKKIATLEENPTHTEQLSYVVQLLRALFPSKETVHDPLAPADKQEDATWILSHVQELMTDIVAGVSNEAILAKWEERKTELEEELRVTSAHIAVEIERPAPSVATPVAFRQPGFSQSIEFRRFLNHGFPTSGGSFLEWQLLTACVIVGAVAMFAGIGVLVERIPQCLTCPDGSDHRFSRYADYCWKLGNESRGKTPSVDSGWDDACWLRFTAVGGVLMSAPLVFPLALLLIQCMIVGTENALYQTLCVIGGIAAILYASGDYLCQGAGAAVRACGNSIAKRRYRSREQGIAMRATRNTQKIETKKAALPTSENLRKELELLRGVMCTFPLVGPILSGGSCVKQELADELIKTCK